MRRHPPTRLVAAALLAVLVACVPGDLDPQGKACDEAHACPAGLWCVLRPVSPSERQGECQPDGLAFACEPGGLLCPDGGQATWLERCEATGHSSRVEQACGAGQACNPDVLACSATCLAVADCEDEEVCDLGLGLCRPGPACEGAGCTGGACVGAACVPEPTAPASSASGEPELDCFQASPAEPPGTPATCDLTGRVYAFPMIFPESTVGLTVRLRDGAPPYPEVAVATQVVEDVEGKGKFTFAGVETNRRYLLEIEAGALSDGSATVATYHPAVDLRADLCQAGLFNRTLMVMKQGTYDSYTSEQEGLSGLDARRGLLLGRTLDCGTPSRQAIGQVTAGVSIPPPAPGRVFYFADNPNLLVPDLGLAATTHKGYYAVAGLPACDNTVGFRARRGATPIALGEVAFPVRAGAVTLLDLPVPAERLPE